MAEYNSSEEFQRHAAAADAFTKTEEKKAEITSEKDKLKKSIDKYIADHGSTTAVRALAIKNKRTNDYQMDLSADIVEILTNIKKGI